MIQQLMALWYSVVTWQVFDIGKKDSENKQENKCGHYFAILLLTILSGLPSAASIIMLWSPVVAAMA